MGYRILILLILLILFTPPAPACKKEPEKKEPAQAPPPAQTASPGSGAPAPAPEMDAASARYAACVASRCFSGSMVCQEQCVRDPYGESWENLPEYVPTWTIEMDESGRPR